MAVLLAGSEKAQSGYVLALQILSDFCMNFLMLSITRCLTKAIATRIQ
jgi:hypothetical protein